MSLDLVILLMTSLMAFSFSYFGYRELARRYERKLHQKEEELKRLAQENETLENKLLKLKVVMIKYGPDADKLFETEIEKVLESQNN